MCIRIIYEFQKTGTKLLVQNQKSMNSCRAHLDSKDTGTAAGTGSTANGGARVGACTGRRRRVCTPSAMSVAHIEQARQANNAADKLYASILEDVQSFTKGKLGKKLAIADAKKLVGLAVACKGNPAAFDDKAKAELGAGKDVPHLGELQRKILARVQDHAKGAQLQSSVAAFSGGVRERVEGGGITKGGLIRASGDKPMFKKPEARSSMLGLKGLAAKKREDDGTSLPVKRARMSFEGQEDAAGASADAGESGDWKKKEGGAAGRPNYRTKGSDTPSSGSGLNTEARDRIQDRDQGRGRDGAMLFNSKGGRERDDRDDRPAVRSDSRAPSRPGTDSVRSQASTWESDTPSRYGGGGSSMSNTPARSSVNTPARSSVDQFDIVANIGQGRVPSKATGTSTFGGSSSRLDPARGGDRDKDRPLTEAEKEEQAKEYEAMEKELDRDWYDNDEGGAFLDESGSYDPFLGGADGNAGVCLLA